MTKIKLEQNIFGFSVPRSGSTYVFSSISSLIKTILPEHAFLGETFNTSITKRAPIEIKDNIVFRDHSPTIHHRTLPIKISGDDSSIRETAYSNMVSSKNTWTAKCFISQYNKMKKNNYAEYLYNADNTYKVLLWRQDIEDIILSKLFANNSKVFHTYTQVNNKSITYVRERDQQIIKGTIRGVMGLKTLYHKKSWDAVITYEHLSGNPYDDFSHMLDFEIDQQKIQPSIKKIIHKEDKIKYLENYNDFYRDLTCILEENNISNKVILK